jgi:hypothetical protein
VRDVIEGQPHSFDVHKLENVIQPETVVIMRLKCESEDDKNEWVRAVNKEVKQIRADAKTLLLGSFVA